MPQSLLQMALRLQKKQQLRREKLKKSIKIVEEDSAMMKQKAESEGVVTSGTMTVSRTDKSEILKLVNSEMPVKMEKSKSTEKTSEDSNSLINLNLPGPSHRMIHPREF